MTKAPRFGLYIEGETGEALMRKIETLEQQNAELVATLETLKRNLSKAWGSDRSGFEQALLDTIDQALAQAKGEK